MPYSVLTFNSLLYLCIEMKQTVILLLLVVLCAFGTRAQQTDSIRISLLTCGAGNEIYSLFGHTAIRYEDPEHHIDAVFNYGMFSFNTPNFILRFTLGETDYQLGVNSYELFAAEYAYLGRDVRQQVLNLTPQEKKRLFALLEENYRPENRVYRYNFFYDNCATRPRDIIEKAVDGSLLYSADMDVPVEGLSFRQLLHQYTESHSWARFGMDLCMGVQADRPINRREEMFVPFCLQGYFQNACIIDREGQQRPLVSEEATLVPIEGQDADGKSEGITPLQAASLLLTIVVAATFFGVRKRKTLWGLDLLLFFCAGTAGCILAFLALFSQHPAVSPNYMLFVFHPLHLFALPWMLKKVINQKKSRYMVINLAVLTLFISLWAFIPQRFNFAVLPLALCLFIRSASNLILAQKRNK